jgi:hypothetical protein
MNEELSPEKNNWYCRHFIALQFMKDMVLAFLIVIFIDIGIVQILFCLLFSVA